jgi:hypothetical protein
MRLRWSSLIARILNLKKDQSVQDLSTTSPRTVANIYGLNAKIGKTLAVNLDTSHKP